jgi:cyclase
MRIVRRQISDDVHMLRGRNGMSNAVAIDGHGAGWTIIDSLNSPALAREMLSLLTEVREQPVERLINTHYHGDHTFGNGALGATEIIAHPETIRLLREQGTDYVERTRTNKPELAEELEGLELTLPNRPLDHPVEQSAGGHLLELRPVRRRAHTSGDLIISLPELGVLLVGDLVFNGVVPQNRDGDLIGLADALRTLQQEQVDVVVPGHGPHGGPELFDDQLAVVDLVLDLGRQVAAGEMDVTAARQSFERECPGLLHPERTDLMLEQAVHAARH